MMRFENPEAFALLVLIPLALWLGSRRRPPSVRFSSLQLVAPLRPTLRTRLRWLPMVLRVLALIGLVGALARPQLGSGEVRVTAKGIAAMVVVDRSYSMIEPMRYRGEDSSRIGVVKQVFREFVLGNGHDLSGRPQDMIGLVTFARFADTVAPLSRVHDTVAKLVDSINLAEPRGVEAGTAIGEGLALAAARLHRAEEDMARLQKGASTAAPTLPTADESASTKAPPSADEPDFTIKSKVIILLTDGDENMRDIPAPEAAKWCKEWGIRVYAIGIGSDSDGMVTVQSPFGRQRIRTGAGFNDRLLRQIAENTGGKYFEANNGEALRDVYREIDRLEKTDIQSTEYTNYKEMFTPVALGAAAALAFELLLASTFLRRSP